MTTPDLKYTDEHGDNITFTESGDSHLLLVCAMEGKGKVEQHAEVYVGRAELEAWLAELPPLPEPPTEPWTGRLYHTPDRSDWFHEITAEPDTAGVVPLIRYGSDGKVEYGVNSAVYEDRAYERLTERPF